MIFYLSLRIFEFTAISIEGDRQKIKIPIINKITLENSLNKLKNNSKKINTTKCNIKWNFCLDEIDTAKREVVDNLIFSVRNSPEIYNDYFFSFLNNRQLSSTPRTSSSAISFKSNSFRIENESKDWKKIGNYMIYLVFRM